ncbi:MAG: hypothetical protein ACE5GX_09780 [Thermoanaerobaculia bacterium]
MKRIHLLRTSAAPEEFAGLFAAIRSLGLRVGWLDLIGPQTIGAEDVEPAEAPPALEAAAAAGVLRAVRVAPGRVATVKPVAGPPEIDNLLREHFVGCSLVLVRGAVDAPEIAPAEGGWEISDGDRRKTRAAAALAAELRRPRFPFGPSTLRQAEEPEP